MGIAAERCVKMSKMGALRGIVSMVETRQREQGTLPVLKSARQGEERTWIHC